MKQTLEELLINLEKIKPNGYGHGIADIAVQRMYQSCRTVVEEAVLTLSTYPENSHTELPQTEAEGLLYPACCRHCEKQNTFWCDKCSRQYNDLFQRKIID